MAQGSETCVCFPFDVQASEYLDDLVFPDSDKLDVRDHAEVSKRLRVRASRTLQRGAHLSPFC